jgi:hypothetical protein
MSGLPPYIVTFSGYVLLATAIFVLAHWVRRGVTSLLTIHRASLIFLAEHDLMAEDYCIRRNIQRHNMRAMAMAIAGAQGDRRFHDGPPNGPNGEDRRHRKGKGAAH